MSPADSDMGKKQETKEQVFDRNVKMKFLSKEEDAREWIEKLQTKDVVGEDKKKKKNVTAASFLASILDECL